VLRLTTLSVKAAEGLQLEQYKQLLALYRPTVAIYEQSRIAQVDWLMRLVSTSTNQQIIDPDAIRYILTLYSICEQTEIHDCYNALSKAGCLHFLEACVKHNLLDGI